MNGLCCNLGKTCNSRSYSQFNVCAGVCQGIDQVRIIMKLAVEIPSQMTFTMFGCNGMHGDLRQDDDSHLEFYEFHLLMHPGCYLKVAV